MKVKTINPIVINNKEISAPSKYLSADGNGMGEYETTLASTSSRDDDNFYGAGGSDDFYNAEGEDDFYGFDAQGNPTKPAEIKMFQHWVVKNKGANIDFDVRAKNGKVRRVVYPASADGKMGDKTQAAFAQYGGDWKTAMKATGFSIDTSGGGGGGAGAPTVDEQVEQAKKGKIWDKVKGWIQSDKAKDLLAQVQGAGGIKGWLSGLFGGSGGGAPPIDTMQTTPPPSGMSKGMKIGLAVGGLVILGIIIYAVTRPKGAVKTSKA
jgi:hypothetical protein